ncbi:alpha/beta fold hydrolase [Kribbella sandramycini]
MKSYTIPGMHVREHVVPVPLDWSDPSSERIDVFARELVDPARKDEELPVLLYLAGGPGGKAPRPLAPNGWVGQALESHRILLLDQRGTGRSTPVTARRIAAFDDGHAAAAYLAHFRADSIVADAEHLRKTLFGGERWSTLGQSYGGFTTLVYLSQAPEGLAACYITGGLAPITADATEVYRRTYPRVAQKNAEFRRRYPHVADRLAAIADRLAAGDVRLPDGDLLTVRRFQLLGIDFGMKPGYERVHWLLDEAFDGDELADGFLSQVEAATSFRGNPLYAVLQEAIYASGAGAPAWAAQAERPAEFAAEARPLLLTGEMMYPWMFEEIAGLRPFHAATEALHARTEWPELYDLDRLAANDVPVAAAVYFDDMYVDSGLQLDTASRVGNLQAWVTNEFEHDGIGSDRVLTHLTELIRSVGGPR